MAHASSWVTGNAGAVGEAAGAVAALVDLCARHPRNLPWGEAQLTEGKLRSTA